MNFDQHTCPRNIYNIYVFKDTTFSSAESSHSDTSVYYIFATMIYAKLHSRHLPSEDSQPTNDTFNEKTQFYL